jgi:5-methylcytosine-specific restriction endonuclease McrA
MTIFRLCARCGAMLDPAVHGYRGPCPDCRRTMERDKSRRRRAASKAAVAFRDSRRWQQVREVAKRRDGQRCRRCGTSERLEVHHITPIEQDGSVFDLDNLVTLCQPCHRREEGASFLGSALPPVSRVFAKETPGVPSTRKKRRASADEE